VHRAIFAYYTAASPPLLPSTPRREVTVCNSGFWVILQFPTPTLRSTTTARNNNTARWPESRQVSALPDLRSYPQGPMLSALGFRSDETAAKCSSCFAASLSRLLTLLARLLPSAPRLPHPNPFGLRHVARHSPGGLRSSAVGFSCSPYGHARASARALPCGAFRGRSVWVASFNRCQRFVAGAGGDTPRSPMQLTMLILSGRSTVARVPN